VATFDDWKNKAKSAVSYVGWENINRKKDEVVEKAKQLKSEHDAQQRQKKEDWIYKKEIELKELEDKLSQRERLIRQKEVKLSKNILLRFIQLAGGFSAIALFVFVLFVLLSSNESSLPKDNLSNKNRARDQQHIIDTDKKSDEYQLSIPTDPGAKYYVLRKEGTSYKPILITKRIGLSGTSYAKRMFDCQSQTTKYLGFGSSIAEMNNSRADPRMGEILPKSIAWYQWDHVCN